MKKLTTEEFIKKAQKAHGDKYDYSRSTYISSLEKIEIICPIHGSFWQEAASHSRKYGCPKCSKRGAPKIKNFINRANTKFNYKFDYSKSIITGGQELITIVCPIHGDFMQSPTKHLRTKYGCPKCATETTAKKISVSQGEFINRSKKIHGNRYDYSLVNMINRRTPIKIICKVHGIFETTPEVHLKGCNCPSCVTSGWDRTSWINICNRNKSSKPCVYVIKGYNDNEEFIKIGRTMRSIHDRFVRPSIMPYKYELINQFFGTPEDIFNLEVKLHRINKDFKYVPKLEFPGNTECFKEFKLE